MKPVLIKQSSLMNLTRPMRPSILASSIQNPALKVKQQIKKVLQTFKEA
jgi:hypothetical protein